MRHRTCMEHGSSSSIWRLILPNNGDPTKRHTVFARIVPVAKLPSSSIRPLCRCRARAADSRWPSIRKRIRAVSFRQICPVSERACQHSRNCRNGRPYEHQSWPVFAHPPGWLPLSSEPVSRWLVDTRSSPGSLTLLQRQDEDRVA